jgi:glyoxylase-like metal-dependent hydrolase (beta-lactamase superfamily II)
MLRKVVGVFVFATLVAFSGSAQAPGDEAKQIVQEVAKTVGAVGLKSIQYSANGYYYHFLQGYRVPTAQDPGPWPKFYAKYSRMLDYEKGISREETIRSQYATPSRGAGYQPLYKPGTAVAVTTNDPSTWLSLQRGGVIAGGEPVLTPHGFVQTALIESPTLRTAMVNGQAMRIVSLPISGKYKVEAYVNKDNLIEKIDTWMTSVILGDILVENTYSDYRDVGGIKFPMRIVRTQAGTPSLELTVTDVQPNAPVTIQARAPRPPQQVQTTSFKIAEGVWFIDGVLVSSAVVEFKDYLVLVESSMSEERALGNIAEAKRLVPGKPIRYNINSHYHSDHGAGIRTFIAEGATIITSEGNKDFYERVVLKAPFVLEPDKLALNPKPANFIWVQDKYVLTDGKRTMEIYKVKNTGHHTDLLIAYMPKEKLLFECDLLDDVDEASLKTSVNNPNVPPEGIVNPYTWSLWQNIQERKLDVERIVLCHGHAPVSIDALKQRVTGTVQDAPVQPIY